MTSKANQRRRPGAPPGMDFFETRRPCPGDRAIELDLGGLALRVEGVDQEMSGAFMGRYSPYVREVPGREPNADRRPLRVRLALEDTDYFITPPETPELNPVLLSCDGPRVRYLGYRVAGWFDTDGGEGDLLLASGSYEPVSRAIENYLRAAVAWQAASRGGALVHAASAVWKGNGYLFFGSSGAGKSTLSACNTRARVVSDDLSLVLPGGGRLELVGSPFRGTYTGGEPVVGRFPLVAGFRLFKSPQAEVRQASKSRLFAELVGSLPFVAEAFSRRPDLFEQVERAFEGVPLSHLHFRKDDSYWDAIERAGL